jgi:hypothetical protein
VKPAVKRCSLAGVVAAAVLAAVPASAGPPDLVALQTTGDRSERYDTIPITSARGAEPRAVMSLGPGKLPDLLEGDRLHVTSELQTTNNCYRQSPFCVARPYSYSPHVGTRLVLADGLATRGARTRAITERKKLTCDQAPDHREHHCVSVFTSANFRIGNPGTLPCPLERCRVSLIADAHNKRARHGDKLILGIDRADGQAHGDKGRVNVARLRGDPESRTLGNQRRLRHRVEIKEKQRVALVSQRLPHLKRGEQLPIRAGARISIGHVPYATFVGAQLVLGINRSAVHTTEFTREVAKLRAELSEANGYNCTQRTTPCETRKVGTLMVRRTAERAGRPVPLYANLVLRNAPKMRDRFPNDFMKIRRGFIEAVRYGADFNGRR